MKKPSDPTPAPAFILLVDDSRHGLLARKSVLEEHGHKVATCRSAEEAVAWFTNERCDLVITMHRLPKVNGTELIKQLRGIRADVPVVLVSDMVDVLGLNERTTGANAVVAQSANEVAHMMRAVRHLLKPAKPSRMPARSQQSRGSSAKAKAGNV